MPPMYLPHQGCTGSRGQGGKIWATIALCYDSQPWLMPSQCTILLKNKSLFLQMLQGIRNFSVLEGIGEGQGISSLLTQSTDLSMWWVMAWQKHLLLAPILPLELWDFFLFLSSWNIDKTFSSAEKSRKWYEIGQTFSAFFLLFPRESCRRHRKQSFDAADQRWTLVKTGSWMKPTGCLVVGSIPLLGWKEVGHHCGS